MVLPAYALWVRKPRGKKRASGKNWVPKIHCDTAAIPVASHLELVCKYPSFKNDEA
jgi:hypothetical protein